MDLFNVLAFNQRVLVWSSEEDRVIITWNQYCTLQQWKEKLPGQWEEIAIRTLDSQPISDIRAREAAMNWLLE